MSAPEKPRTCPHCGRPSDPMYRPFCSKRCKDVDLGRWLNEDYRVPVVEQDQGDDPEDGRE